MRKRPLLYATLAAILLGCAYTSGPGSATININRYLDLDTITSVTPAASAASPTGGQK